MSFGTRCGGSENSPLDCLLTLLILRDAGPPLQMTFGMFLAPVTRSIVERCRRRGPAERPVMPEISPDATGIGPAAGKDRHPRVVAVEAPGGQNMRLDQHMQQIIIRPPNARKAVLGGCLRSPSNKALPK